MCGCMYCPLAPPQLLSPVNEVVRVPDGTASVLLDCTGTGDPSPVTHWLFGDTVLPTGGEQVKPYPHTPEFNFQGGHKQIMSNKGKAMEMYAIMSL